MSITLLNKICAEARAGQHGIKKSRLAASGKADAETSNTYYADLRAAGGMLERGNYESEMEYPV